MNKKTNSPRFENTRRDLLMQALFGTGLIGLRALATGLPAAAFLNPASLRAADASSAAQFLIFSTSSAGDPVNCNVPGTYDDPAIGHPNDPSMAATSFNLGSKSVKAAQIWSKLPAAVLARMCFFHHGTYTVIHPDEGKVLRVMGALANNQMLPSMISAELAAALGTVRAQPISLHDDANEAIVYQGAPQPLLTPTTLGSMLALPGNGLGDTNLVKIRDKNLDAMNAYFKQNGTSSQRKLIDDYALSKTQLRSLQDGLLANLGKIKDNSPDSQVQAAIVLFQMKVTPVATVHIPFGGDNHGDNNLAGEVAEHKTGIESLAKLYQALADANLQDKVSFAMTNVFGRTMAAKDVANGRQHNDNHHVTLMIGSGFKGSIAGGVSAFNGDYKATGIVASTGEANNSGDVPFADTFASMAKTLATGCGMTSAAVDKNVVAGKVVTAALKS